MDGLLDRCIVCGNEAKRPGAGICTFHEIQALIDLSVDRLRDAIRGRIPTTGKRLQSTKGVKVNHVK